MSDCILPWVVRHGWVCRSCTARWGGPPPRPGATAATPTAQTRTPGSLSWWPAQGTLSYWLYIYNCTYIVPSDRFPMNIRLAINKKIKKTGKMPWDFRSLVFFWSIEPVLAPRAKLTYFSILVPILNSYSSFDKFSARRTQRNHLPKKKYPRNVYCKNVVFKNVLL